MKALLIVDIQNDFLPGGALGVEGGDQVIPIINELIRYFSLVVSSQDWHPPHHVSFASSHPGKKIHDQIEVGGKAQVLWPDHCIQNSYGAEISPLLHQEKITRRFYKGVDPQVDSYSAFFDHKRHRSTGLADFLKEHQVHELFIAGLTTDYCVLYSALDALELGFEVTVVTDGCKPVAIHPQDESRALETIRSHGGNLTTFQAFVAGSTIPREK